MGCLHDECPHAEGVTPETSSPTTCCESVEPFIGDFVVCALLWRLPSVVVVGGLLTIAIGRQRRLAHMAEKTNTGRRTTRLMSSSCWSPSRGSRSSVPVPVLAAASGATAALDGAMSGPWLDRALPVLISVEAVTVIGRGLLNAFTSRSLVCGGALRRETGRSRVALLNASALKS